MLIFWAGTPSCLPSTAWDSLFSVALPPLILNSAAPALLNPASLASLSTEKLQASLTLSQQPARCPKLGTAADVAFLYNTLRQINKQQVWEQRSTLVGQLASVVDKAVARHVCVCVLPPSTTVAWMRCSSRVKPSLTSVSRGAAALGPGGPLLGAAGALHESGTRLPGLCAPTAADDSV
jgi:hypothetical protein